MEKNQKTRCGMKFADTFLVGRISLHPLDVEEIAMQFRWVIPITLWTMLSGPVLARPKPPLAGHVQGSATVVSKYSKSEFQIRNKSKGLNPNNPSLCSAGLGFFPTSACNSVP
jgi:hypothetical protein